jgi:GNAT superfamily N-acetyltransferase
MTAKAIAMNLRIADVDPQGEVALALLRNAAIDVQPLYGGDSDASSLRLPENVPLGTRDIYVAAWLGDVPVGCGAIREMDQSTAEVQRMYVHRDYRRRQFGRTIMVYLEKEAKRLGYSCLLLETGNKQVAAMAFYETSGFYRVQPFGRHVDDPTSVCYARHL